MRLIDADMALEALINKGQASRRYKLGEIWELNGQEIREALNTVPSAQQPKGHWIRVHPLQEDLIEAYMCSECKVGYWEIDPESYFFCPHCGANMREVQRF